MPVGWEDALGLVPEGRRHAPLRFNPGDVIAPLALAVPDGSTLVGIDENTALVGPRRNLASWR